MFSDVVLSPEVEYAKKNNEKETRFGAREQKSVNSATQRDPIVLEYGAMLCQSVS